MIENLKPYESYRATDLPWARRLPSHWSAKRGKAVLEESMLPTADGQEIVTCFRDGQVTLRRNRRTGGFMVALYEQGYQGVRNGQLVVHAMDAFAGAIGICDSEGKCTPEYVVCNARGPSAHLPYIAQTLRVAARDGFILASCPSVRERAPRFRWANLGDFIVPLPPPEEQAAIAHFLDHANARIDQFIRSKKKLIALLNEQKQGIIHRAVTRGLDPNVKLKHSGVPWVGEVPAHWQLTPNRKHLRIRKVLVGARHREYQLLSLTKRGVIIRDISANKGKFSSDMGTSQEVRAGDLVFCLFDVPETPRTVGLSSHDGMITGAYTVMECRDSSIARFLEAFYIAMDDRKLMSPLYSGLRNTIPKDRLLGANTPIPPGPERERVLSFIAKETCEIQSVIDRTSAEIALVQEYRTRLVSDIVTGQLDVRAAAASLLGIEPESVPSESSGEDEGETNIEDNGAA